jgi:hypothetical protein
MRYYKNDKMLQNKWVSIYFKRDLPSFKVAPASYFDNRWFISFCGSFVLAAIGMIFSLCAGFGWWSLIFLPFLVTGYLPVYIHLPIRSKYDECDPPQYGFYLYHGAGDNKFFDSLWICRGEKTKCVNMPWSWQWVRTSMLLKDGTYAHETKGCRMDFWHEQWKPLRWSETHKYTYKLNDGTVQEVNATITVKEREWRWRGLTGWRFPGRISRSIEIDFSSEVGEETGSWKGGCTGCGYTLRENELPVHCLRRMEKERKF